MHHLLQLLREPKQRVHSVVSLPLSNTDLVGTQASGIVIEADIHTILAHARKLTAILPGVSPGTIIQRGANGAEKATRQCRMASVGRGSSGLLVQPARHVIELIVGVSDALHNIGAEMF